MQIYQECLVMEHKNQPITHLCVYKMCSNVSRWACRVCKQNKFHNHMQQNNNHLIDKEQIIHLLSQQQTSFEQLISQIQEDLFSLTRQQINRIINIHQQNDKQLTETHEKQNAQKQQKEKQIESTNELNEQELNYALHFECDINQRSYIFQAWISPNKQFFLIYKNSMMHIFDLELKQELYQKKIKHVIYAFFSYDSIYFIVITYYYGRQQMFWFRVNIKFKLSHRLCSIEQSDTNCRVIFINPFMILVNKGDKIILNHININKFQTLQPLNKQLKILAGEYCQKQKTLIFVKQLLNEVKSYNINFIEISTKRVIIQQKFIQTNQIQVIDNNQLISTEHSYYNNPYRLCLWQINYSQQKLTILRTFKTHQEIGGFHYFNMHKIFIYFIKSIQIINLDFQIKQEIRPQVAEEMFFIIRTSPLIEYIIFTGKKFLQVLRQIQQL